MLVFILFVCYLLEGGNADRINTCHCLWLLSSVCVVPQVGIISIYKMTRYSFYVKEMTFGVYLEWTIVKGRGGGRVLCAHIL